MSEQIFKILEEYQYVTKFQNIESTEITETSHSLKFSGFGHFNVKKSQMCVKKGTLIKITDFENSDIFLET